MEPVISRFLLYPLLKTFYNEKDKVVENFKKLMITCKRRQCKSGGYFRRDPSFVIWCCEIIRKKMEHNVELFIDPEEDEIFFYGVSEREYAVKTVLESKIQLQIEKRNENCSNKNDHTSKDVGGKLESESSLNTIDQMADLHWSNNCSNKFSTSSDNNLKDHETAQDKCPVTVSYQENLKTQATKENIESPRKQNIQEKIEFDQSNCSPSVVNVHSDHNYSIPIKNVIDKSILKTPKSIVKADKDGGFLKVLSEIALAKAEEDENNIGDVKNLADFPSAIELNDDDKENKQSDTEKANAAIKVDDLSAMKAYQGLTVNKSNNEGQKRMSNSFVRLNEGHSDFSTISDVGNKKTTETVEKQFVLNEERELESLNPDADLNDPSDELGLEKSLALGEKGSVNSSTALEKLNDTLINYELTKERGTNKISNGHILKEFDNFQVKSYERRIMLEEGENLEGICSLENKISEEEPGIRATLELNESATDDVSMESEGKNDINLSIGDISSSGKERNKKFVRRNTMRLLEELNELVTFGQAKRESLGNVCSTSKLSEEAAKVIQKLKAVGFDDSICSPEQYFDLDKLDNSVFNSEISDILNDTLSKPLSHITSKDVESLLEKITTSSLEVESEVYSGEFNSKKENSSNVKMNKNIINESEKSTMDQPNSTDFEAKQFEISEHENESERSEYEMSSQCESDRKVKTENNALSTSKYTAQKSTVTLQAMETKPKEFRSAEKKFRVATRIPKLASTTSKIPVTAKEVKQQLGYLAPNKTPFLKAQKSLKFNNIDCTVNTNVNSKMPVIFSTGKVKAATRGDTINTNTKNVNNKSNAKNLFPKSESKSNSQFQKFKGAISSKENSKEGQHIPKVLKLPIGNSPVTAKYGGSVQRTISKRP